MHWGPTVPPSWPAFSHTQLAISRTAGQTRQQLSMRPACLLVGLAVAMVAVDAPVLATKPCGLLTLRGRALAASGDGRKRARWKLNPEMRFMRPGGWEHLKKRGQKEAVARLLDPDPTGAIVFSGRQPWLSILSSLLRFPCQWCPGAYMQAWAPGRGRVGSSPSLPTTDTQKRWSSSWRPQMHAPKPSVRQHACCLPMRWPAAALRSREAVASAIHAPGLIHCMSSVLSP